MKHTLRRAGDHWECPHCGKAWPTPVTNRVVKERPLDPRAEEAANREVALKCPHIKDPSGKPRALTMEDPDYPCRRRWMDAYLAYKPPPARVIPDDPCQNCPKTGTLVVKVIDNQANPQPVADANVHITDLLIHRKTSGQGIAKITDLAEKSYAVTAWKDEYTEEVAQSPQVRAGKETECTIRLKQQLSGTLPVLVLDEKDRPVEGAKVVITPVYKSHGSYKPAGQKTDTLGETYFYKLRYNTYSVVAEKDRAASEKGEGKVLRPGMNPRVTLRLDRTSKLMSIQVASARWYKASPPPSKTPSIGIMGADVYFRIWDYERNSGATYLASHTHLGVSWGAPWTAGRTLKAGTWRDFTVTRSWQLDEAKFGGTAHSTAYSIKDQMYFDLEMVPNLAGAFRVSVAVIAVGEGTFELPGLDWFSGYTNLVKQ